MKQQILQTSLVKSMKLLELLVETGETGVSDLGRKKALNRSNVHRILSTFRVLGYVEKNSHGKYRPTLKLFELGRLIIQRNSLIKISHPFLELLGAKCGETINLAILDREEVTYVDKMESSEVLRMDLAIGRRVPAYCTALGKILLAGLKEEDLLKYLNSQKITRRTANTVSSIGTLKKQLEEVKAKGYAIDDEELYEGIRCIAGPIRNQSGNIIASISLAGPATRMTFEKLETLRKPLLEVALKISRQLGFRVTV